MMYFASLGASNPEGSLKAAIARDFASAEAWAAQFSAMGKAQGGGSVSNAVVDKPHAAGVKTRFIEGSLEAWKAAGGEVAAQ